MRSQPYGDPIIDPAISLTQVWSASRLNLSEQITEMRKFKLMDILRVLTDPQPPHYFRYSPAPIWIGSEPLTTKHAEDRFTHPPPTLPTLFNCPIEGCKKVLKKPGSIIKHVQGHREYRELNEQERDQIISERTVELLLRSAAPAAAAQPHQGHKRAPSMEAENEVYGEDESDSSSS